MAGTDAAVDELGAEAHRRLARLERDTLEIQWRTVGLEAAARDRAAEAFMAGLCAGLWLAVLLRVARRVRVTVVDDAPEEGGPDVVR